MKKRVVEIIVAACIAIAALGLHTIINSSTDTSPTHKSIAHIQSNMHRHEELMNEKLMLIIDSLPDCTDTLALLGYAGRDNKYSFYIFRNNRLAAWHNAMLPTKNIGPSTFSKHIIKADNGWYYSLAKRTGSTVVAALFRIRSQYSYNNEYLKATFDASFGIEYNSTIIIDPADVTNAVTDANGNYLFSIINVGGNHMTTPMVVADAAALLTWLVAALVAIFGFLNLCVQVFHFRNRTLFIAFALLGGLYAWALAIDISQPMSGCFLLSSQVFAYDWWIPSLANLLLLSMLVMIWCYVVFRLFDFRIIEIHNFLQRHGMAVFACMLALLYAVFVAVNITTNILVHHSSDLAIYVDNLDVSGPSLVKVVILSFLFISFLLVLERIYGEMSKVLNVKRFAITMAIFCVVVILPSSLLLTWFSPTVYVGFVALNVLFFFTKRRHAEGLKYSSFVWLMFASTLFFMLRLTELNADKEKQNRQLLANNLSFQLVREDDPVAEALLLGIEHNILADSLIHLTFEAGTPENTNLYAYIKERYFDGYFSRYDLQVVPCVNRQSTIQFTNSGESSNCFNYFTSMLAQYGSRIANKSNFYCLYDNDGRASYFGSFNYRNSHGDSRLYIEINAKPYSSEVGYPELLTNSRDRISMKQLKGYSYAKYFDGYLSTHYGNYNYPKTDHWLGGTKSTSEIKRDNYSHLTLAALPNQTIVLSYPQLTISQFIADYSFLFLSMFTVCSVVLLVISKRKSIIYNNMSIHERIQSAFVLFAMSLLIVICVVTGKQSITRYEEESRHKMSLTLASIKQMLSHELGEFDNINQDYIINIDNILQRASNLFFADAHIYSTDGQLIGSSRRELFMNGIVSPLINSEALHEMRINADEDVFLKENIGQLVHFSMYSPLFNNDDELIGYINVPYFTDVNAMRRQLLSTLVPITNAYMLIILMAILFSFFLAKAIAKPLISISENIREVGLRKQNKKIFYPVRDEIGILVEQYNRMLDELADSTEKLAQSERESTWREMAKQIAHEIKNPLTPMKLSVQHMLKAWDDKRDGFDNVIHKVGKTLVEQIDQLSFIASEFSNIAKAQPDETQRVDVVERLATTVSLFGETGNAQINFTKNTPQAFTQINPKQLTSVFNNLIKNALQAGKTGEQINIDVSIGQENGTIHVSVADNGHGIPPEIQEKIFKPNFTTKSTGMGLGLAISKTIITNANGKIWFETEQGQGTTFFVTLPAVP